MAQQVIREVKSESVKWNIFKVLHNKIRFKIFKDHLHWISQGIEIY